MPPDQPSCLHVRRFKVRMQLCARLPVHVGKLIALPVTHHRTVATARRSRSRPAAIAMAFSLTQLQDPESSTFTYFLADESTKNAVVIDPVLEQVLSWLRAACSYDAQLKQAQSNAHTQVLFWSMPFNMLLLQVDRDMAFVQKAGLYLKLAINTHCHADHITGTGALKHRLPQLKSVISAASKCKADILVKPGDQVRLQGRAALLLAHSDCVTDRDGQDIPYVDCPCADCLPVHMFSWSLVTQACKCLQRLATQAAV